LRTNSSEGKRGGKRSEKEKKKGRGEGKGKVMPKRGESIIVESLYRGPSEACRGGILGEDAKR